MSIYILPLLVLSFFLQTPTYAQEKVSTQDKIIASTLKTLAKTYVATADIDQLKKKNIEKIKSMKEERFNKKYQKIYKVIKDLPPKMKARYGVDERMTKKRAIDDIASLDKKKINEIIDAVPDAIIAAQFREHLAKERDDDKDNVVYRIHEFWDGILRKVNQTSPSQARKS